MSDLPGSTLPLVRFLPDERESPLLDPGRTLLDHARAAGVELISPCGGKGRCGKCRVVVSAEVTGEEDPEVLPPGAAKAGIRLACRCRPAAAGPLEVQVPESSRPARLIPFLSGKETAGRGPFEPRPPVAGRPHPLGAALDLGTSNLAGVLLDLADGRVLAQAGEDNPQARLGEDVISRIVHAEESPGGIFRLQELLVQGVDSLIGALLREAGNPAGEVREVAVAANTAVSHFLHGIDPAPIRRPPYTPATLSFPERTGAQLGSSSARAARWRTFPALGGFVGGTWWRGWWRAGSPGRWSRGFTSTWAPTGRWSWGAATF